MLLLLGNKNHLEMVNTPKAYYTYEIQAYLDLD